MEKYKIPIYAISKSTNVLREDNIICVHMKGINDNIFNEIIKIFAKYNFVIAYEDYFEFKYNSDSNSIYLSYAVGVERGPIRSYADMAIDELENLFDLDDLLKKANKIDPINFPPSKNTVLDDIYNALGE